MLTNFSLSAFAGLARLAVGRHGCCEDWCLVAGLQRGALQRACVHAHHLRGSRGSLCTGVGFLQIYLRLRCCTDCPDGSFWRSRGALNGVVKGKFKGNEQAIALWEQQSIAKAWPSPPLAPRELPLLGIRATAASVGPCGAWLGVVWRYRPPHAAAGARPRATCFRNGDQGLQETIIRLALALEIWRGSCPPNLRGLTGVSFSKTETVKSLEDVSGCQLFHVAPKITGYFLKSCLHVVYNASVLLCNYTMKFPPCPCAPGFCSKAASPSLFTSIRMSSPVSHVFSRIFTSLLFSTFLLASICSLLLLRLPRLSFKASFITHCCPNSSFVFFEHLHPSKS